MEVEDALSAKFRVLIQGLMTTTTSEIVKIFSKVLLETRMEITRSWREIDLLKQQLEECEQERTEAINRAHWRDFKREDEEIEVSSVNSQSNTVMLVAEGPKERAENVSEPETTQSSKPGQKSQKTCATAAVAENSQKTKCQEQKCTQPKIVCPANVSRVKGRKSSSSKTISQPTSKTMANKPSTSVDIITNNPKSKLMKKRKLIKMQKRSNDVSVARALRDRQHLSMQRHCLCCSSDECDLQSSPSRALHQVPSVYICRKCERRFKTDLLFKSHNCPMPQNCIRCGQTFTTLQGLTAHSQESEPQFSCSQCEQTFATQCALTVHKQIHTNIIVPKDIKAKRFEVRLQRIPDSQLEAALSSKSSLLQNNSSKQDLLNEPQNAAAADTSPGSACKHGAESKAVNVPDTSETQLSPQSVAESLDSRPGTLSESGVGQSSVRKVYAVMSTASCQIQIIEDANGSESPAVHESEKVTDKGNHASASDESGLRSPSRKRKKSDCSHDAYNGVFPVENILKWRNNKGRNEVWVKWMPCTLCGAKFRNTWEPAENFPGYLDDKNEELKKD
ncbi:zinc finger protein with KRAB and SCAN domains 8 [Carassius gibelio]|uniref:zinc finger protein with KRAB and SCAN domains 8 n=1 Tax=Carassius gibelio TaxID=101364 RepID=UPI002277A06B|nr:zinc finger protein with KRAB and SCAN domains 8 [Carassius gibelio]XP_052458549.1 zinc finger protein with KRAB and SCAN domains 8 [Carassius gibelio]